MEIEKIKDFLQNEETTVAAKLSLIHEEIRSTNYRLHQLESVRLRFFQDEKIYQLRNFIGNGMSRRTFYALARGGIQDAPTLQETPIKKLEKIRGVGKTAIEEVKYVLATLSKKEELEIFEEQDWDPA